MPNEPTVPPSNPVEERMSLRRSARSLIDNLKQGKPLMDEGASLAQRLRDSREFDVLEKLTDQLREQGDENPKVRRLQAQSWIEQGKARTAIDMLEGALTRLEKDSAEWGEAHGLMGRAYKQVFFDADDKTSERAQKALTNSIKQYAIPYQADPSKNVWQGLNVLALANYAKTAGMKVADAVDGDRLAKDILSTLGKIPDKDRDNWYHASLAEAQLATGDLDSVEANINTYVTDPKTTAFALGGTLRQFTDLWTLDKKGEREHGIVQALRAALTSKEAFDMDLTPDQFQRALTDKPDDKQFEAILGPDAAQAVEWFEMLINRAKSVCGVYQAGVTRIGTGFLVRGSTFKAEWGNELFVLTNAHVVSENPADEAIAPEEASVRFQTGDKTKSYEVDKIMWTSPRTKLDGTILKLKEPVKDIEPVRTANALPLLDGKQRIYVIGHPGGGDLKISFQDNVLLDHEGPTAGTPVDPTICHLHYRAATEKGSSGSPVFNGSLNVIALHHAGGTSVRRLNGKIESWPANEGVWIRSIIEAVNKA